MGIFYIFLWSLNWIYSNSNRKSVWSFSDNKSATNRFKFMKSKLTPLMRVLNSAIVVDGSKLNIYKKNRHVYEKISDIQVGIEFGLFSTIYYEFKIYHRTSTDFRNPTEIWVYCMIAKLKGKIWFYIKYFANI